MVQDQHGLFPEVMIKLVIDLVKRCSVCHEDGLEDLDLCSKAPEVVWRVLDLVKEGANSLTALQYLACKANNTQRGSSESKSLSHWKGLDILLEKVAQEAQLSKTCSIKCL